jgi:hypothetical protein
LLLYKSLKKLYNKMATPVKSIGKRSLFLTPTKSPNTRKRLDQTETPDKYCNVPYLVYNENAYTDSKYVQTELTTALNDTSTCQVSVLNGFEYTIK